MLSKLCAMCLEKYVPLALICGEIWQGFVEIVPIKFRPRLHKRYFLLPSLL
jgi:hypothetical protein